MAAGASWRRIAAQAGTARVAATLALLALAAVIGRYGWQLPVVAPAERAFYDVRAVLAAPAVAQDSRIALVVYTDDTLAATGKRSPLDRTLLANALRSIDGLGPRAIGIDILLDQPQPEDAALIAALRALATPTYLAFATAGDGYYVKPWQEAHLRDLLERLRGSKVRPAAIRIDVDADGSIRTWPEPAATPPPLLAIQLAPGRGFDAYRGALAMRLPAARDRPVFSTLPIDLFADPAAAALLADQIRGRIVLIGADLSDTDRFATAATRLSGESVPGVDLHAALVAQALDGRPLRQAPGWALWLAAGTTVVLAAATGGIDARTRVLAPLAAAQVALLLGSPLWLQAGGDLDTLGLPAFGLLLAWGIATTGTSALSRTVGREQRRFAQSALGRYLPVSVAEEILRDPDRLALHGERRAIYALFTDIEGFTAMSQSLTPEEVATVLNTYLDTMSAAVLSHGGTIDKFVGDAVVAFWGAPLARPDDAVNALTAAQAMSAAGTALAEAPDGPRLGRTRVGLHWGEAVVGNFGGEGRIQYTALGDSMNVASRLEGANKALKTGILVSREAAERAGLERFRAMGRVRVRGRDQPIEVFEPLPAGRADTSALFARFDRGDEGALDTLRALALADSADLALSRLIKRLETVGPGGTYDLD